jgi:hypothetical protein
VVIWSRSRQRTIPATYQQEPTHAAEHYPYLADVFGMQTYVEKRSDLNGSRELAFHFKLTGLGKAPPTASRSATLGPCIIKI